MLQGSFYTYDRPRTNLDLSVTYYPSLSDPGRRRLQLDAGAKRELWKDFFVAFTLFTSYDSRPPNPSADTSDVGIVASDRLDLLTATPVAGRTGMRSGRPRPVAGRRHTRRCYHPADPDARVPSRGDTMRVRTMLAVLIVAARHDHPGPDRGPATAAADHGTDCSPQAGPGPCRGAADAVLARPLPHRARAVHARQRPAPDRPRRSLGAGRRRERLVPRRLA